MFWGLNLKANRKYTQTTSKSFHISQAALDGDTTVGGANQIFITCDNQKFLVCTLRKDVCEQVMLDYNFAEGDEISFQTKGDGSVSLTGYIVESDMMDYMNGDESSASELEEEAEPDLRTAINMKKKVKKALENANIANEEEDDDEDEDDEDFEVDETVAAGVEDEEDDDEEEEEDEDDDDDDDENEEDADDDDDAEDEEDDEEHQQPTKKVKLDKAQQKQNGAAKQNEATADKKQKNKDKQAQKQEQQKQPKQAAGGIRTLSGGVKVEDIRVGTGPEVKTGKRAVVYYEGRLKSNNKVFDSLKQGSGFKFSVGRGEVIKGWDIGVAGMKVGGKRRITCPPHMGYGARGSPPAIPPNSTLVFEVELKGVN